MIEVTGDIGLLYEGKISYDEEWGEFEDDGYCEGDGDGLYDGDEFCDFRDSDVGVMRVGLGEYISSYSNIFY